MALRQIALGLLLVAALAGCAVPSAPVTGDARGSGDPTEAERRARVRLELASAYFGRGQTDTALEEVKQALAVRPDYAEAYNLRGLIFASKGDASGAEDSFRRALQIQPRDSDTLHNYGWLLCQQRRYDDASAQFALALAQPNYRDAQRTMLAQGACEARAGRMAEAERTLLRSYELDPTNPVVAYNLSEVLYRRGEYERARFYVRRLNQQSELSNAQSLWLAARIENKLGNRMLVEGLGRELRGRFPQAPETQAFERGRFDE